MHLCPKSHLNNIHTNNFGKTAQYLFAHVQDAKKNTIPARDRTGGILDNTMTP